MKKMLFLLVASTTALFPVSADTTPVPPSGGEVTPVNEAAPAPVTPPPVDSQTGLIQPSDNEHAPYIAVFKGSVNGLKNPSGIRGNAAYAAWLQRQVVWAEDNEPSTWWDNVEGGGWQLEPWGNWVQENPKRRLILGVPIIPGAWDGSGTKQGLNAHQKIDFETGATGAYNLHYENLAKRLVKYHLGNSILRLGIEFNGGWFAWRVKGNPKAEAFAAYWKQIVTTMRAVPGAEKLEFTWNPGLGCYCSFDPEKAWPGDAYVDYIGLDTYDDSYAKGTYPWPKDSTPQQIEAIQKRVWETVFVKGAFGLNYWKKFAEKHHKPLAFPEWGVDHKPDHHGGGDNPYFIEKMHQFINDPANNVAWHAYFDYQAGDGHHQLAPKADGTVITEFPKSAAKFQELFSLPPKTAAAPTSTP